MLLLCLDIRWLGVDPFSTKDPKSINMSACISCKSKKSNDRCQNKALNGVSFCGKHVKLKEHRIWHEVNNIAPKITLISKIWKGYSIRSRLKLAGPGVLNRERCHNEDELVLLESKDKLHPQDYFAFEEKGLLWWFDIRSIIGCLNSSLIPLNPYTRQPLTIDTRRRLRSLYMYRLRNKLETQHCVPTRTYAEAIDSISLKLCQVLCENGFEDVEIRHFSRLNRVQQKVMLHYILMDMRALATDHPKTSRRHIYVAMLKHAYDRMAIYSRSHNMNLGVLLIVILHEMTDPYPFCFIIMSALYRL